MYLLDNRDDAIPLASGRMLSIPSGVGIIGTSRSSFTTYSPARVTGCGGAFRLSLYAPMRDAQRCERREFDASDSYDHQWRDGDLRPGCQ
jgi:hypothetical protein